MHIPSCLRGSSLVRFGAYEVLSMSEKFEDIAKRALFHAERFRRSDRRSDEGVRDGFPPMPTVGPGHLRSLFDVGLPEEGRDGSEIIDDLARAAEPGLVGNVGSNFFGWVMGASHPVGVAADWLTSAWGQNSGIYHTAPAAAVAEDVVSAWLLDLLDLPGECSVGFATGATMASFTCLAAARSEVMARAGWDLEERGIFGAPEIRVFLGEEAHITIDAALRYLGFGADNCVRIDTDGEGRMSAEALGAAMDAYDGPKIAICQAGHINSGAFDPVEALSKIVRAHDAWLHVDGAFGLWARAASSMRSLCSGVDLADSWSVDGHKWLQMPYDAGYAIVKNSKAHVRAMDNPASYLEPAPGDVRSPSQFGPELSRRARGFAAWAVFQSLGRKGIEEMVLRHCSCAKELEALLLQEPGIEILNTVELNQLAIGFGGSAPLVVRNAYTEQVVEAIQKENTSFVAGAEWRGRKILRVSVISRLTDSADVKTLAASIIKAWRAAQ
jgi:glutamate/tyrosine decarboxylase-like PLP-dependent enzyme